MDQIIERRRPKGVHRDVDRHGNVRWYLRLDTGKIRLPGGPDHPHFEAAYNAAKNGEPKRRTPRQPKPRTKQVSGYIYFLRCGDFVKVGYSRRPLHRLDMLKTGMPQSTTSFCFIAGKPSDERALHEQFKHHRSSGEWFKANPSVLRVMAYAAYRGVLPAVDPTADRDKVTHGKVGDFPTEISY